MSSRLFKTSGILQASSKMLNGVLNEFEPMAFQYFVNKIVKPRVADIDTSISYLELVDMELIDEILPDLDRLGDVFVNQIIKDAPQENGKVKWVEMLASMESKTIKLEPKSDQKYIAKVLERAAESLLALTRKKKPKHWYLPKFNITVSISRGGLDLAAECIRSMSKYKLTGIDDEQKKINREERARLKKKLSKDLHKEIVISLTELMSKPTTTASEYEALRNKVLKQIEKIASDMQGEVLQIKKDISEASAGTKALAFKKAIDIKELCDEPEQYLAKKSKTETLTLSLVPTLSGDALAQVAYDTTNTENIDLFVNGTHLLDMCLKLMQQSTGDGINIVKKELGKYRTVLAHELVHIKQLLIMRAHNDPKISKSNMQYENLDPLGRIKKGFHQKLQGRIDSLARQLDNLKNSKKDTSAMADLLNAEKAKVSNVSSLIFEFEKLSDQYYNLPDEESRKAFTGLPRMKKILSSLEKLGAVPKGMEAETTRMKHDHQELEFFSELGDAISHLNNRLSFWLPAALINAIIKFVSTESEIELLTDAIVNFSDQINAAAHKLPLVEYQEKNLSGARDGLAFLKANNYLGNKLIADKAGLLDKMLAQLSAPAANADPELIKKYNNVQAHLDLDLSEYKISLYNLDSIKQDKFLGDLYKFYKDHGDMVAYRKWQRATAEMYNHVIKERDSRFSHL